MASIDEMSSKLPVATAVPVHTSEALPLTATETFSLTTEEGAATTTTATATTLPRPPTCFIPTTTDVVPLLSPTQNNNNYNNNHAGMTLIIRRRDKEIGRDNPWDVVYQGCVVHRIYSGGLYVFYGLHMGEQVHVRLRGQTHVLTIAVHDQSPLHVNLKHKVQVKSNLTGVSERCWIEPTRTDNQHLQDGCLSWQGPQQRQTTTRRSGRRWLW